MRRFVWMVPFAALLTACQIAVDPGPTPPPTVDTTVTAQTTNFPASPVGSISLPAGQDRVIRVQTGPVSTDARRLLVLEIEATAGTRLDVYDSAGRLVGSSRRPSYFAATSSAAALAAATAADASGGAQRQRSAPRDRTELVDRSSVSVAWTCVGPCVAIRPPSTSGGTTYYMVVRAGSSQTADIFAYQTLQADQNEANNTQASATVIPGGTVLQDAQGAIEWLGDEDWYRIAPTGWGGAQFVDVDITALQAPDQLEIYAYFPLDDFILRAGEPPAVVAVGEYFVIRARTAGTNTTAGGPAGTSSYNIFIEPI